MSSVGGAGSARPYEGGSSVNALFLERVEAKAGALEQRVEELKNHFADLKRKTLPKKGSKRRVIHELFFKQEAIQEIIAKLDYIQKNYSSFTPEQCRKIRTVKKKLRNLLGDLVDFRNLLPAKKISKMEGEFETLKGRVNELYDLSDTQEMVLNLFTIAEEALSIEQVKKTQITLVTPEIRKAWEKDRKKAIRKGKGVPKDLLEIFKEKKVDFKVYVKVPSKGFLQDEKDKKIRRGWYAFSAVAGMTIAATSMGPGVALPGLFFIVISVASGSLIATCGAKKK